jgi:hypothetical protein
MSENCLSQISVGQGESMSCAASIFRNLQALDLLCALIFLSYFVRLEEEHASMTWIHEMTKSCPRCTNPIEVNQIHLLRTKLMHVLHSSICCRKMVAAIT